MGMSEKIRILLVKRNNMSISELASKLDTSAQNFSAKMKRDNFTEKDLQEIARVLDCEYKATFIDKETGKEII